MIEILFQEWNLVLWTMDLIENNGYYLDTGISDIDLRITLMKP